MTYFAKLISSLCSRYSTIWGSFRSLNIFRGALIFMLATSFQLKSNEVSEQSDRLLKDLERQITATVAAIAEIEARAGVSAEDIHILIEIPAKMSPNLGLVLDLESEDLGYKVLSTRPSSLADELGLRPGDIITSVNGVKVNKQNRMAAFSELENTTPGEFLGFRVIKNGKSTMLRAMVNGKYSPSIKVEIGEPPILTNSSSQPYNVDDTSCGSISTFFTPPETERLYPAIIEDIDDLSDDEGPQQFNKAVSGTKLKPGKYKVYLHESITDRSFTRRHGGMRSAKAVELEVKPNIRYHLGAQFIYDKALKERTAEYWEPVVWKETELKCEL